jgi:hypothetical protein
MQTVGSSYQRSTSGWGFSFKFVDDDMHMMMVIAWR